MCVLCTPANEKSLAEGPQKHAYSNVYFKYHAMHSDESDKIACEAITETIKCVNQSTVQIVSCGNVHECT